MDTRFCGMLAWRLMNDPAPYPAKVGYDEAVAERYDHRPPWRHRPEMSLLEPALRLLPSGSRVLDAPCGAGRVSVRLAEMGMRVTSLDISPAMLARTREKMRRFRAEDRVMAGDLEKLPFSDGEFDGAVCFRFFSHLPDDQLRRQVVGELCRVARQYVIISFFHPVAVHNLKRLLQTKLMGKPQAHYFVRPNALDSLFAPHGYQRVHLAAQSRYLKSLWLAVFRRK
jgi:ubiquinone/menaquinone biosynthesis C-methylase UbiE